MSYEQVTFDKKRSAQCADSIQVHREELAYQRGFTDFFLCNLRRKKKPTNKQFVDKAQELLWQTGWQDARESQELIGSRKTC